MERYINMSKNKKIRANVRGFADADYLDTLSEKDRAWYNEVINGEYYSNEINREGSIHRKELKGKIYTCIKCQEEVDAFDRAKKQTYNATNSQNRDAYGISSVGTFLQHLEDPAFYDELVSPVKKVIKNLDPNEGFRVLLSQVLDEVNGSAPRSMEKILTEFGIEMVKMGASLTRERTNAVLRKRKERNKIKNEKKETK